MKRTEGKKRKGKVKTRKGREGNGWYGKVSNGKEREI